MMPCSCSFHSKIILAVLIPLTETITAKIPVPVFKYTLQLSERYPDSAFLILKKLYHKALAANDKNDVISTAVGANEPKLVNYPLATSTDNLTFSYSWDFHLQAGSAAIGKGTKEFVRNFPDGITINGVVYTSPEPSSFIGAFGTN